LEGTPDESVAVSTTEDDDRTSKSDDGEAIQDISLRSINAVLAYEPFIQDARREVTAEMESMVMTGLKTLVRAPPYTPFNLSLLC
jgi:hypothetical protein